MPRKRLELSYESQGPEAVANPVAFFLVRSTADDLRKLCNFWNIPLGDQTTEIVALKRVLENADNMTAVLSRIPEIERKVLMSWAQGRTNQPLKDKTINLLINAGLIFPVKRLAATGLRKRLVFAAEIAVMLRGNLDSAEVLPRFTRRPRKILCRRADAVMNVRDLMAGFDVKAAFSSYMEGFNVSEFVEQSGLDEKKLSPGMSVSEALAKIGPAWVRGRRDMQLEEFILHHSLRPSEFRPELDIRISLVKLLTPFGTDRWIRFDDAQSYLKGKAMKLFRTTADAARFSEIEGQLLRYYLCGPLFFLGAVNLGIEKGQAVSFCVTEAYRRLFRRKKDGPIREKRHLLRIEDDMVEGENIWWMSCRDYGVLRRMSDLRDGNRWIIREKMVLAGLRSGITASLAASVMRAVMEDADSRQMLKIIEKLDVNFQEAMAWDGVLIWAHDAQTAQALGRERKLSKLLAPTSDEHLFSVAAGEKKKVRDILRKEGFLPMDEG